MTAVPYNNYDIIFKSLTNMFQNKALTFFGLDTARIVRAEPTELPQIKVEDRRMDFVFYLEDDTYLHMEFQTTASKENLERFKVYDVAFYDQKKKDINTVVIYGAGITSTLEKLDHGSVKYETKAVYMNDYDGDQIYNKLLHEVENCKSLEDIDQLNLILLPLMRSNVDKSQRAIEAVELAKKIKDERQQTFLIGSLVGITDKFIDKEYVSKMMEVLRMARVLQELYAEAESKGLEKGRIDGIAEGEINGRIKNSREVIKEYLEVKVWFL